MGNLSIKMSATTAFNEKSLSGSPGKNRPLEFLKNTEFLQTFCVEEGQLIKLE
jgi:hypothetical protein